MKHQQKELGATESDKVPVIDDNVFIGWRVAIVGDIIIADNVKIGANAVVVKSIDTPNVSVGGVPAGRLFGRYRFIIFFV
ncbi:hypothetical protein K6V26_10575 [Parabacteroides goldsteinii]|nr:hypothetical protein [Parabacteroides goldsteinii]UBD77717.1 hypothetical protein K6V26_10575 [Parabacteroides goldsteinii]